MDFQNLPIDLQSKRNQLIVVGSLLSALLLHTFLSAGGFQKIEVQPGVFPGGDFAFKFAKRDYAAAPSLLESVANDAKLPARDMADRLYVVYFDDPNGLNGHAQRFAAGYLATDKETRNVHKKLMEKPKGSELTDEEKEDMSVSDVWASQGYESETLPSVNCGVVHFPHTNGIASALLMQYKVIPALRKYASDYIKDRKGGYGVGPIVVSTCSVRQEMCTHYVPLFKTQRFHLGGRPDSETYRKSLKSRDFESIDWEGVRKSLRTYVPGASHFL
jgi:hypothetical protein